jgi:TPR repeat protein
MNRRLFALFFILFSLTCSVTAGKKDNIEKLDKKSSGEVKQKIQMHLRLAQKALKNHKNKEAIDHYKKASKLGDTTSQCFLGSCYLYGLYGTKKDKEMAVKFYRKAAKKGNKLAQEQLSRCFADGTAGAGKPGKAPKKSAKWSRESHRL